MSGLRGPSERPALRGGTEPALGTSLDPSSSLPPALSLEEKTLRNFPREKRTGYPPADRRAGWGTLFLRGTEAP